MDVRRTGSNVPASNQSDDDRRSGSDSSRSSTASTSTPGSRNVAGPLQGLARRNRQASADPGRGVIETDGRTASHPAQFQSLDAAFASLSVNPTGTRANHAATPRPSQPQAPATRPRLHRAPAFAAARPDPRQQMIEGMAAPSWHEHMFQGLDAILSGGPASLDAVLASPPPSTVLSGGDRRTQAELDHTAAIHQARPTLGLEDLQADRDTLGSGTPDQVARGRTYAPRLAQAEGLIRQYFGADGEHRDESALQPFRALAQEIGADVANDHEAETVSSGDYLKVMDQIGVMFRRVPDDE